MREKDGLTFLEIAERLQAVGITSPLGRPLYQQIVFSLYRNWTERLVRERRPVRAVLVDVSVS